MNFISQDHVILFLCMFFISLSCGSLGVFLILRRIPLMGDAISHSLLPGLVLAYLIFKERSNTALAVGALTAAFVTSGAIDWIKRRTRLKQDVAIAVVFSSLFALGLLLINVFASNIDLDADCVLFGELAYIPLEPFVQFAGIHLGPPSMIRIVLMSVFTVLVLSFFYKELTTSSLDEVYSLGVLKLSPKTLHWILILLLSFLVVTSFQAVGAILVVAQLILPGAAGLLIFKSLAKIFTFVAFFSFVSAVLGVFFAYLFDVNLASSQVLMASSLFFLIWVLRRFWI
jgi:manganese/zinc/iron transport system permease protein